MLAVALAGALAVVTPAHAASPTVVSLTFDDGQSSQYDVLPILQAHGMTGTFYINSAMVGSSSYYMGWPQIHDIATAGNEIGGHTLHHVDLTTVDAATAQQEVCDDRANLVAQGYNPVSFAYPFASYTTAIEQMISSCGYTSARGVGGARTSETIPPLNPYVLRTPAPSTSTTTVQDLENEVTATEAKGGGWVILTFHGTCEDLLCTGSNSTKLSTISAFLDWLQARQANGTIVKNVGDVMGGSTPTPPPPPTAPTTYIQCNAANCQTSAYTAPVSVSFVVRDHNPSSVPTTWYTTDGSDPTTSSTRTAYTAPFKVTKTSAIRFYTSDSIGAVETPQSQTIAVNLPTPTTTITCNGAACASTAYSSPVSVALSAADPNAGATTTTYYTTDGSDPTSSATRSTYTAPFQVGTTSTVKYYSTDSLGATETPGSQTVTVQLPPPPAPTPPTTTITCDNAACASTAYSSPVSVALSAADPNAGATTTTWYTTDGSDPTTSATRTAYAGAFPLAKTGTVKYYSTDSMGATEATKSQTVTVQLPPPPPPPAPSAPTTSMKCNDAACGTDAYHAAVSVTLHADDPQGAPTTTWYTTDGSDPTTSATRTAYAGAFSLAKTGTVKYYSTDSLGATEQVRSQSVTVELPPPPPPVPPTTTISCNDAACSFGWYRAVTVRLHATGTGATTTWYTTDGSDPVTSATRTRYAGAFTLRRTSTVRFYSTDAGGANESQQAQHVRVDSTGPSVSITSPKDGSRYARSATVTLTARATDKGSGVRRVLFLDGTKVIRTVWVPVKGSTYRCSWSLRHVALGTHRIRVVALDAVGNKGWASSVKVTVHR